MKIEFKGNEDQKELLRKMASKSRTEAQEAQEIFAALMSPVLGEVFAQANTTSLVYRDMPFDENDDPSFPINAFKDIGKDRLTIWSQGYAGGLPTNKVYEPIEEIKFQIYRLDSAIAWDKKYARKVRMPIIAKYLERLLEELAVKQDANAWAIVMAALADATHNGQGHVFRSLTADVFSLEDFNKALTYFRTLNRSWVGGTPVGGASRITDMVCSPAIVESLRSMAYQPINTKVANNITPTTANDDGAGGVVTLPESERARIFNTGNAPEFFGVNIVELLEFGANQDYIKLLNQFHTGTISKLDGTTGAGAVADADDLILFLDASKDIGLRAVETSGENPSTFSLEVDDQFTVRSNTIGYFGSVSEGRVVVDTKGMMALVV
jgi:hypothetical protein